jgi:predicted transcriptional regulator
MRDAAIQNSPALIALDIVKTMAIDGDSRIDITTIGEHVGKIMQTISGIEAINPGVLPKVMGVFKYMVDKGGFRDIAGAASAIGDIAAILVTPGYSSETGQASPAPTHASKAKNLAIQPAAAPMAPTPQAKPTQQPAPTRNIQAEQGQNGPEGGKKRKMRGLLGEDNPHLRPPSETGQKPAVNIRDSVQPDYIICLEDGKHMTMMKRHLRSVYGMTPEQYRKKWGLPPDYPMVAPQYALKKSQYAKQIGLGLLPGKKNAGKG